ncbi:TolB family protein [Spongiimicrobium sp. 2-473A-2-J]|uniref:TolB family protein n=1 Tax=Eudoraea algarum TaxID=3417568 RepID=UPI003D3634AF
MRNILMTLLPFLACSFACAQVWSPNGEKIAFFYIHSIEDIYTVNLDGSDFQILEGHPERDFAPRWSPDGKHIMFTTVRDGHHEIYRFNPQGKEVKRLTEGDYNSEDGDYSPDGRSIVFSSNRTGNNELYIMNSEGKHTRRLTNTEAIESTPRWSPDGSKILFRRAVDEESEPDLYTINPDGTDLKQLTDTPKGEFHQSWSSDGQQISYITVVDGAFEMRIIPAEGGESKVLVRKKGYQAFYPHWSPDNKYIAFTRDVMEGTQEGLPALFIVDMKGNERMVSDKNSF